MINIRNLVANKIELARGEDFPIKSFLSFQDAIVVVGFTFSLTSLLKNALCLSRVYLCSTTYCHRPRKGFHGKSELLRKILTH